MSLWKRMTLIFRSKANTALDRAEDPRQTLDYSYQRQRYGDAFRAMGITVYTGDGGFYHWCELPEGMNAEELNDRLFKHGAAILCAKDCDMARPHDKTIPYISPYARFFRFSFGPLLPETFEDDIKLFGDVLAEYKKDVGL